MHGSGHDQVEQVVAQRLFLGETVKVLRGLVPVCGRAVRQVALYRDRGNVAQQRAKAHFRFAQRVFTLDALGDVARQIQHGGRSLHFNAQRSYAGLEMAHACQRLQLVLHALGLATGQGIFNQLHHAFGQRCRHHLMNAPAQHLPDRRSQCVGVGGQHFPVHPLGVKH